MELVIVLLSVASALAIGVFLLAQQRTQIRIGKHIGLPHRWGRVGFVTGESVYRGYRVVFHGSPLGWGIWPYLSRLKVTVSGPGIEVCKRHILRELSSGRLLEEVECAGSSMTLVFPRLWFGLLSGIKGDWRVVRLIDAIIDVASSRAVASDQDVLPKAIRADGEKDVT